jgi:hypothetical protein
MQAKCAKSFTVSRKRKRQAQQDAATLEERTNWTLILLRLVGAVDLQAQIRSIQLSAS